ncbi:speckle-type POZ [Fusarium pseudocircinatum]|uniref:Speckle-type POZ n=1 Tax=Fusarium pseudocircinatum TaxID=56676 RepID=A0A8H5PWU9_9HYPO|nr:speckle-type POZ [Fusarium pseudocircinatum]
MPILLQARRLMEYATCVNGSVMGLADPQASQKIGSRLHVNAIADYYGIEELAKLSTSKFEVILKQLDFLIIPQVTVEISTANRDSETRYLTMLATTSRARSQFESNFQWPVTPRRHSWHDLFNPSDSAFYDNSRDRSVQLAASSPILNRRLGLGCSPRKMTTQAELWERYAAMDVKRVEMEDKEGAKTIKYNECFERIV